MGAETLFVKDISETKKPRTSLFRALGINGASTRDRDLPNGQGHADFQSSTQHSPENTQNPRISYFNGRCRRVYFSEYNSQRSALEAAFSGFPEMFILKRNRSYIGA